MHKIIITSAITLIASLGQIMGQTTSTTTSQSQNRKGKTETYTQTETVKPNGQTITTTTTTSTVNGQVFFGLKVNANVSNFFLKGMDDVQSTMGIGFSTGAFMKIESGYFAIQYELLLQNKSSKLESLTNIDYKQWALELPLYLMGQIFTGSGKIFIGAGPYVGMGLNATQSPESIVPVMHRWDFGVGVIFGYEFGSGISLNCNYQAGLINRLSAEKENMSMKNQTVSLGIGYKF